VKKMIATGAVYTISNTREATGNLLVWTEATAKQPEQYTMTGTVYVKEPKDPKPPPGQDDCNWSQYSSVTISPNGIVRAQEQTGGQNQQKAHPCTQEIPGKNGGQ